MRKKSNQKKEKKIGVSEKMGNATPGPGVVTGKNGVSRSFALGNPKKKG